MLTIFKEKKKRKEERKTGRQMDRQKKRKNERKKTRMLVGKQLSMASLALQDRLNLLIMIQANP